MSPAPPPSPPATRAEFQALLAWCAGEALRKRRHKRHVAGFPLLLRQLEAVSAWTAPGRAPGDGERALIVLDRIAADELADPLAGLSAEFRAALVALQNYLDLWPGDPSQPDDPTRVPGASPVPDLVSALKSWIAELGLRPPPIHRPPWMNRIRAFYYRVFGVGPRIAFGIVPYFCGLLSMPPDRETEHQIRTYIASLRMLLESLGQKLRDPRLAQRLEDILQRTELALEQGWWSHRDALPGWAQRGDPEEPRAPTDLDEFVRLLRAMDVAGQACHGDLQLEVFLVQRVLALLEAATDWIGELDARPAPRGAAVDGATLGDRVLGRRWDGVETFARAWAHRLGGAGAPPAERSVRRLHDLRRELHARDDAGRLTPAQRTLLAQLADSVAELGTWCRDPQELAFPRWDEDHAASVARVLSELGEPDAETRPLATVLRGALSPLDGVSPNALDQASSEGAGETAAFHVLLDRARAHVRLWLTDEPEDAQARRLGRMLAGMEAWTRPGRAPSLHVRGALPLRRCSERELGTAPIERAEFLAPTLSLLEDALVAWPPGAAPEAAARELDERRARVRRRVELSLAARMLALETTRAQGESEGRRALGELARELVATLAYSEEDPSALETWADTAEELAGELRTRPGQLAGFARKLNDLAKQARAAQGTS